MWQLLGLIDCGLGAPAWRASHAFLPTPLILSDDTIRVYAAFLDAGKVGRVGYVDLSARDPLTVTGISPEPVLDIGAPGCFDDHGVTPMTAVRVGGEVRLYYTGWQMSSTIRYYLLAGLAVSSDGGQSFSRLKRTPLLERSDAELTVRTAPHVMFSRGKWRMWYIAGSSTIVVDGKQVPTYAMRYLESADGLAWGDTGRLILSPSGEDEYGFGRPYVLETPDGYGMWYSVRTRSRGYRFGYAVSADGIHWTRRDASDKAGPPAADWDSDAQAFAAVVDCASGRYLFYNGNDFGRAGFGVARWND